MKTLFRWAFRCFILLVILAVAGILLLDTIAREVAETRIKSETGLDVKIGRVRIGLFIPSITVENLVLYNRAEFGGSPLLDLPELHVEYDRQALLARKLHCQFVRLNLAQLNVVEDKNGRTNLDALRRRAQSSGFEFAGIDTLNLTLGKATFMRMSHPGQVDELKLDIHNQVLTNIKSAQDLTGVLMVALLRNGVNLLGNVRGGGAQSWIERLLAAPGK
jgi:uncharacterized protein involved in outer membrane biogenesis